jgi:Ca-activated chloride channel family protein
MKSRLIRSKKIPILFPLLFISTLLSAQQFKKPTPTITRILFMLDASQSMAATWKSDKKINIARNFLINTVDSVEHLPNVLMALRVYGHQSPVPPQDCSDTRLEVPFTPGNASAIRQKLRYLNPKGTTPIAGSLQKAISDFPPCENCRNIIILITDGKEACDGDPCAVSLELQRKGILLKPFIIGIGLDPNFRQTFECIGQYFNAEQEEKFQEVLKIVITQALDQTTAQVNLLDINGEPTETDVPMTFYNKVSGRAYYHFYHTLNNKGYPDTLLLDPLLSYKLVVHTLPPVEIDNITLTRGKHNIIGLDAPQGTLVVSNNASQYRDLSFIVRKQGDSHTLNWQNVNNPEKYLVGKYEVEIPTLPRLVIPDVEIRQSHTTTVELPKPGIVTIINTMPGLGSLYLIHEDGEHEWIYNTLRDAKSETIVLLPGTYRFVFRPQNSRKSIYTLDKKFTISPGASEVVKLY